jgi:hypothetical protein
VRVLLGHCQPLVSINISQTCANTHYPVPDETEYPVEQVLEVLDLLLKDFKDGCPLTYKGTIFFQQV